MATALSPKGIPLYLIPAISNLDIEPIGQVEMSSRYFAAKKLTDDGKRLELLKDVRDFDYWAPDLRARRGVEVIMARLAEKHAHVSMINLEHLFVVNEIAFNYKTFGDYFHFTKRGHQAVAKMLGESIFGLPPPTSTMNSP